MCEVIFLSTGYMVGVFDMLRAEHIYILNAAGQKCRKLAVGVFSDSVVEKLSGQTPVIHQEQRMRLLGALSGVDQVFLLDRKVFHEPVFAVTEDRLLCEKYGFAGGVEYLPDRMEPPAVETLVADMGKIREMKAGPTVVGYTTGVFDMFHVGHLNLLEKARALCDFLVVGVSTDDLVESYKHKRPNVSLEDRLTVIQAMKMVDAVVVQESMDKYAMWEKLQYRVIFHGDDWKGSDMYRETEAKLKAAGVKLTYFPYTQGISSTMLREKVKA